MIQEDRRTLSYIIDLDENDQIIHVTSRCHVYYKSIGEPIPPSTYFDKPIPFFQLQKILSELKIAPSLEEYHKKHVCFIYEDMDGYCHILYPEQDYKKEVSVIDLDKLYTMHMGGTTDFLVTVVHYLPTDLTFRDAWKKGDKNDPIKIDFEKAVSIHRQRLQEACERKIEQLNAELQLSVKKSNLPEQVAITKTQEILRTLHLMDMSHCKTIEDVKYCVPRELHDVWGYYELSTEERPKT